MILYKIKAYSSWHFGHTQQAGLIQIKNKSSTVKKDKTIWLLICNVLADQSCFESIQAGQVNGDLRKHNSGGEEAILEDFWRICNYINKVVLGLLRPFEVS